MVFFNMYLIKKSASEADFKCANGVYNSLKRIIHERYAQLAHYHNIIFPNMSSFNSKFYTFR